MTLQNEICIMPNTTYAIFRKCKPDWKLPLFTMPNYDLSYIVEGKGKYVINDVTYTAESGDLFCSPPGSTREGTTYPNQPMKIYAVDFHLKDFSGEFVHLPISIKTQIGIHKDLIRLFNDLTAVWNEKPPGYTMKIHGILLLLLHRIHEICIYDNESRIYDYRITKAIRYINANYQEKIMVKKLAEMTRLEPHYFNTLFKEKTGISLHQYLIKTRIQNAHNMIQAGNKNISEIAILCGYTDIYHFYKQFKMVIGIPPSKCVPGIQ